MDATLRQGSRRALAASFLALVLVAGCGGDGVPAPERGRLERLELGFAGSAAPQLEAQCIACIEVPAELPPWKIRSDEKLVRTVGNPAEGGYHVLLVRPPEGGARIEVPGPFDPTTFNLVVLRLQCLQGADVRVSALRSGKAPVLGEGSTKSLPPRKGVQEVAFEMPELRSESELIDALGIVFLEDGSEKRPGPLLGLVSVELRHRPWSAWLPSPDAPAQMVAVGSEMRPAKSLSSRFPLRASLIPGTRASLELCFGIPARLRDAPSAPTLRVTLRAASGEEGTREAAIEEDPAVGARWHALSIPLREFEPDEEVEARFELVGSSQEEIVCALGEPMLVERGKQQPTVVVVTSDTHRADYLGVADSAVEVRTPFLDGLAARGAYFTDCLAASNVTNPSHVALMTATSPRDTGVIANQKPLAPDMQTLAESFRSAGYVTLAGVCAIHLGHRQSGLGQGFDRLSFPVEPQRNSAEALADLERWLPDAEGLPLFVWLHLFDAHAPYDAQAPYHSSYWDGSRDPRDASLPPLPAPAVTSWTADVRDLGYVETLYRSEVSYVDAQVERLLAMPRMSDAWIAFTADHGESLGAHDIYWDHRELYPENLHVPLILAGPGVPAGLRCDRPVEQIDTARTLLDLAGLETAPFPGTNLLRIAAGEAPEAGTRFALAAHALSASVLSGAWFLVLHLRDHSFVPTQPPRAMHEIELYDVARDPQCASNLAEAEHERAARMRGALVAWLASARSTGHGDSTGEAVDTSILENLEALGYTGETGGEVSTHWIDPACECERCLPFRE